MEDQAIKVVGEVGEREFCLRTGNADGPDKEPVAALLVGEDMLDPGADC